MQKKKKKLKERFVFHIHIQTNFGRVYQKYLSTADTILYSKTLFWVTLTY